MLLYYISIHDNRHVRTLSCSCISGPTGRLSLNTTEKLQGLWRDGGQPQPGLQRSISTRGRRPRPGTARGIGAFRWLFSLREKVCTSKGFLRTAWKYVYQCWMLKDYTFSWLVVLTVNFCVRCWFIYTNAILFISVMNETFIVCILTIFSSIIPWWIQDPIAGFNRKTSTLKSRFLSSPTVAGPTQFNTDGGLPNRRRDKWWEVPVIA